MASRAPPLRYRLPNPPPVFVGRKREAARLAQAIERGPVAVVWGLGGLGKTALALRVVHEHFASQVKRTLLVRLATGDPAGHLFAELTRALGAGDTEKSAEAAFDAAERQGAWILLDDLHHAGEESMRVVLRLAARYARRSRWLATSRVDPRLDVAEQVLALGPLSQEELAELARRCAPELTMSAVATAVSAASGSPWALRQAISGARPTASTILDGVPEQARRILAVLALLEGPLPRDELERLGLHLDDSLVEHLVARGLVELRAGGIDLHDVARSMLASEQSAGEPPARWAAALGGSTHPEALLEALRLFILAGELDRALALLESATSALLLGGQAARLWRVLEHLDDPRFCRRRLEVAVAFGDPSSLAAVRLPPDANHIDRLRWARSLFMRGQVGEAARVAQEICADADTGGDEATAFEAGVLALEAGSLADQAPEERVVRTLERSAPDPVRSARRDACLARVQAFRGDIDGALRLIQKVGSAEVHSLPVRLELRHQSLIVLVRLGRIADAARIFQELHETAVNAGDVYFARYEAAWRAVLATAEGRLVDARAASDELEAFTQRFSVQAAIVRAAEIHRRLAAGELEGVGDAIHRLAADAQSRGFTVYVAEAELLRARLALLEGDASPAPARPKRLAALVALRRRLRSGLTLGDDQRASLESTVGPWEAGVVAALALAERALLEGDTESALRCTHVAERQADEIGYRLYVAEALQLRAEVLTLAGRWQDLAAVADALAGCGREFPSARHAAEAAFFTQVASSSSPAELERLAGLSHAPTAMRRARALLGATVALDAVDARVVEAARAHLAPWRLRILSDAGQGPWRLGWGLDTSRREVWLPDGRRVSLVSSPLSWLLLEALASSGGEADKERLAAALWPGESYDPRVHLNRLFPMINKIRQSIEDDPSNPSRLITTSAGYALDAGVRILRRES